MQTVTAAAGVTWFLWKRRIAEVTDAQVVGLQDAADRDACAAAVNSSAIVASAAADFFIIHR